MASPLIRADFCGPYIGDCINGIKEKGGSAYLKYRRIPKVIGQSFYTDREDTLHDTYEKVIQVTY